MQFPQNTYASFSDESSYNDSRFCSIAALSIPANNVIELQNDLTDILDDSNVTEFKWNKLKGAKYRHCAIKLVEQIFKDLNSKKIRIDVLIWDTHDERHEIIGRDDTQNFERMFFHLHKNLMTRREFESVWHLRPDENTAINWNEINNCLGNVGKWIAYFDHPLLKDYFSKQFYTIKSMKAVSSEKYPLIQIADLFAGLGVYSRKNVPLIKTLRSKEEKQVKLFEKDIPNERISNSEEERFKILNFVHQKSREMKLGVSLKKYGYLKTMNPKNPINFWHYTPQHPEDIAPVRD